MNVYDFDGTIYLGDSTLDFYFFELKRNKKILKAAPRQAYGLIKYLFGLQTKTEFKEYFYSFIPYIMNIDNEIEIFWEKYEWKIKDWYKKQRMKTDIIISASPEFLLFPLEKKLGVRVILASLVDKNTGKYIGINCYGEEKVRRLEKFLGKNEGEPINIDKFYSDSYSDKALALQAQKRFLVKKDEIREWKI